ncbi:MAG: hypothetical protein ACRDIB_07530, partial [Ardenticatenaceae bacterium]
MATLFEQLDTALQGGQLSASVTVQSEHLATIVTTVAGLVSNPPDDFGDFLQQLAEMPLPDLDVGGNLATNLSAVGDALPTGLEDVTGSLFAVLGELENQIGLDLTNFLGEVIDAVGAINRLIHADLTCGLTPGGAPSAGGGGDGG